MLGRFGWLCLIGIAAGLAAVWLGLAELSYSTSKREIVVLAAAVMAGPLEAIRPIYEGENPGVTLSITYDGSWAHLAKLRSFDVPADIFIAAEWDCSEEAARQRRTGTPIRVAAMSPVIVVRSDNPKGIAKLDDLLRDDVRLSLADPDAAAIGRVTKRVLQSAGLWEMLAARVERGGVSYQGTVIKAVADVDLNAGDATVAWNVSLPRTRLQVIHDPRLDGVTEWAGAAVVNRSQNPEASQHFLGYLHMNAARTVFREYGFTHAK